jgi:hypothetical protein
LLGRREPRAHVVHHADIAVETAHQPLQAVDILFAGQRRQERLRTRIVVGIIERLHRDLQQDFVAVRACAGDRIFEVAAIGHERERDRARIFESASDVELAPTPSRR